MNNPNQGYRELMILGKALSNPAKWLFSNYTYNKKHVLILFRKEVQICPVNTQSNPWEIKRLNNKQSDVSGLTPNAIVGVFPRNILKLFSP